MVMAFLDFFGWSQIRYENSLPQRFRLAQRYSKIE